MTMDGFLSAIRQNYELVAMLVIGIGLLLLGRHWSNRELENERRKGTR